jgi:hypothetical protein
MLEISQNLGGNVCQAEQPLYTPNNSSTLDMFSDQKWPNYLPKGVYRIPPEYASMNVYFYFYCVVKRGNCALGINERIKNLLGHKKKHKP